MLLLLRGHLRESFSNTRLYDLVNSIYSIDNSLKIYIHTWNVYANNRSWRQIKENSSPVTREVLDSYFGDLAHLIVDVMIDDDTKIQLTGKLDGNVSGSGTPIRGWKNYWYGKFKLIERVQESEDMIVNCRFDILENNPDPVNMCSKEEILRFIQANLGKTFTRNVFIRNQATNGIDNIYIGNAKTLYTLIHKFHHSLDTILQENYTTNPEQLVFKLNMNT